MEALTDLSWEDAVAGVAWVPKEDAVLAAPRQCSLALRSNLALNSHFEEVGAFARPSLLTMAKMAIGFAPRAATTQRSMNLEDGDRRDAKKGKSKVLWCAAFPAAFFA